MAIRRTWGAAFTLLVTAVCLAIPGPIIGLFAIWLFNRDAQLLLWMYDRTLAAPCLALIIRGLPVAIFISWYALRSLSPELLEAASLDGASSIARFWRIVVPQRLGAFATAMVACVAIAMGDLSASILVTPPGVSTIATRVFGLLHAGVDDQVAGLCLVTVGMFVLLGLIAMWCAGRWDR